VGRSIINIQSGNTNFDNLNFFLKKMPYRDFIQDNLLSVLQIWLPFFIMLSFIITALQTTKGVTYEKEKRLKVSRRGFSMLNCKQARVSLLNCKQAQISLSD
jgi:hypothetical protein